MYKKIISFIILGMMNTLPAQSINEQIEAVKNAQPHERVEMMNRLKVQIAAMNEAERMQAINVLQKGKSFHQTSMQLRTHQTNINKGRNTMQQLKTHKNAAKGSKGQRKR